MRAAAESPWIVVSEGTGEQFIDCHIDYGKQRAAFRISLSDSGTKTQDELRRLVSVLADAVRENRIRIEGR
ncbi:MAG TPA: hypothetical protein VFK92_02425 [Burkholderiales bacterium]|nr:hypothetical protein [Burkholderiales bacterium]